MDLSDTGSVTGSEPDSDSDSDADNPLFPALSRSSSSSSVAGGAPTLALAAAEAAADAEFANEVRLSLERAFAEGHSLDNAAVELKTLRMASNVPIARVRAAVIAAIVDRIPLVEGDAALQRKEITTVLSRWGELITKIGGIDAVDTIVSLQVRRPLCLPFVRRC
jgi:translation initiation factor eIF-2B subunit epsilon